MAAGRIAWYGVSSNTATASPDDPEATSLWRMLEAATVAGGPGHHFRVLQVPMNLFESGATLRPNTGPEGKHTVLDLAMEAGVGILVNRPLNAFAGGAMVRLADLQFEAVTDIETSPEDLLRRVAALEAEYRSRIAPHLRAPQGGLPPADWFRWADQLRTLTGHIQGMEHWRQVEGQMIGPMVAQFILALDSGLTGPRGDTWRAWRDRYLPELESLLQVFRAAAARQSQDVSDAVAAALNPHLPVARASESLSRKALWVLAGTPGVSCVLVGMRHPAYVADGMGILDWPPLPDVHQIYQAMRQVRIG